MVATLTTRDMTISTVPLIAAGGESEAPEVELSELTGRPASWRSVPAGATDWFSCLERRRGGAYLPI